MKQLFLTFLLGGIVLIGCQKESIHEIFPADPSVSEAKIKVRIRENLESIVADLLQSQSFKVATLSPGKKAISEISALTSNVLEHKAVKKDTLLFVVKNADIGGSVIVSANVECEPIIAILDSENISLGDLVLDTADVDNPFTPILLRTCLRSFICHVKNHARALKTLYQFGISKECRVTKPALCGFCTEI